MNEIPARDRQKVGAVVVTYHPDAGFDQRLALIVAEFGDTMVVDNSVEIPVRVRLSELCGRLGCQLILNDENRGLGGALNTGFSTLAARDFAWAVAFDQDSTPEKGFGGALLATAASGDRPAAIIGANWSDEARPGQPARHLCAHPTLPLFFRRVTPAHDLDNVTCVIASGTLFQLSAWREVGGFDESLFLDLVDSDFCLRTRNLGNRIRVAAAARMGHRRGAKRPVKFAGRTWWPAFMPEFRLRGLFRNRLLLFRRHAWKAPHWAMFEICYATKVLIEIVFLEDRKAAKLQACLRGTWDGLRGRRGPLAPK